MVGTQRYMTRINMYMVKKKKQKVSKIDFLPMFLHRAQKIIPFFSCFPFQLFPQIYRFSETSS